MAGHVLTPLDGSPLGEAALPFASAIADRAGWDLHLVNVHVPDPRSRMMNLPVTSGTAPMVPSGPDMALGAKKAYLEDIVARYEVRVKSLAALRMEKGGIPATIRGHAERLPGDLIVMATHGRTGIERVWLGSVADAVARRTRIPVLLVRDVPGRAPADGMARVERVLVPLDTSALAETILEPVMELGSILGWSVLLLHVVPTRVVLGARSYPLETGDVAARHRRGTEYLRGVAARVAARGLDVEIAVLENEDPTRTINRLARERDVDLVAMASHGRGGLTRAILGSVSDGVLAASGLPLLLGGGGTIH